MAARLVALGVAIPNIDPVGAAQDARSTAINQQGAKLAQEAQAFEQVAQMGLGVMGGKLDGQVDPQKLSTMITLMGDNPIAQQLKDHPELLPVITRGSVNVLGAVNNQQEFDLRKQQLALELKKFEQSASSQDAWKPLLDPAERAKYGIQEGDKSPYLVNIGNGEVKPISGKGMTVNVGGNNDIGTIPSGKMVTRDANGNVTGMVDIPGSPTAQAAADAAAADKAKADTAATNADIVTTDIGRALEKIAQDPEWTTGAGALLTGWQPGSDAKSVYGFIDTIRSNAALDKLQALRDASKTGGALGAISDREDAMLADAVGKLDPTQKREDFEYNLKRVFNIYRDIIDGPGNGPRYDLMAKGAPLVTPKAGPAKNTSGSPDSRGTSIDNAEETKMLDGVTYWRIGTTWYHG